MTMNSQMNMARASARAGKPNVVAGGMTQASVQIKIENKKIGNRYTSEIEDFNEQDEYRLDVYEAELDLEEETMSFEMTNVGLIEIDSFCDFPVSDLGGFKLIDKKTFEIGGKKFDIVDFCKEYGGTVNGEPFEEVFAEVSKDIKKKLDSLHEKSMNQFRSGYNDPAINKLILRNKARDKKENKKEKYAEQENKKEEKRENEKAAENFLYTMLSILVLFILVAIPYHWFLYRWIIPQ